MSFQKTIAAAQVKPGQVVAVELDDTPIALVHCADGVIRAVHDECSHAQVPLSDGEVDGCTLECFLHGSRFDLRTGEPSGPPAMSPVPVYPVEIRDGDIYVSLDASNGVHW